MLKSEVEVHGRFDKMKPIVIPEEDEDSVDKMEENILFPWGGASVADGTPIAQIKNRVNHHRFHKFEPRQSTTLTLRLLEEIRKSISSFRPSMSLAMLAASKSHASMLSLGDLLSSQPSSASTPDTVLSDSFHPKAEIDIVISGGGLKGYFMSGFVVSTILLACEIFLR